MTIRQFPRPLKTHPFSSRLPASWLRGLAIVLVAICARHAPAQLPLVEPAALGLDGNHLQRIDALVAEEIAAENLPGCVVAIGRRGAIGWLRAYGHRQLEPTAEPMNTDTIFDMASITKPVATATSIMLLVERGQVRLRDPVSRFIPEFGQNGKEKITIEQLLTHQGGLVPDNSLKDYQHGSEESWKRIWALQTVADPGTKFIYTDVGFLVLAQVVQRVTGQSVAQFAETSIFEPLGMRDTGYTPEDTLRPRIAPTEQRDGQWLLGEVHDPRAALLDGVAGHAGLFSTANDLALYAETLLAGGATDRGRLMSQATFAEMIRPREIAGHYRGLGWDSNSKYSSNRGEISGPRAFGHGGFTGTAMWIDPDLDLFVIFLSSRLHPDGKGSVNQLAGRIGAVAAGSILGPNPLHNDSTASRTSAPHVPAGELLTGIDVLVRDEFRVLAGRRVGLITNQTGADRNGNLTVDLLHAAQAVELVAIFSPEHGLRGKLDVSHIDDIRDEQTGLPVYSLYGESRRPSAEQLAGIDTLVFDIQDIGTRFYTYIATMKLAMETAAEQGVRFVVLDRPNPIGGVAVAGPVLDAGKEKFVAAHTLPVRHGMTVGELARMFCDELDLQLDLSVIAVEGWRRSDYWDATGLTWINPSPNIRNLTQAVIYPGVGLLETTNLSVGRGTDTPFQVLGAPWIDRHELAEELNAAGLVGVRFVPIRFTPESSKFKEEVCDGVNLVVVDRNVLKPVQIGLTIACTLRRLYPDDWETTRFNRLLGNDALYNAITAGCDASELEALIAPRLESFLTRRAKYFLYP